MNEIVFIMGKSASGKDRIYRELSEDKALGLNKITMYTTRPLRSGEAEGREYHFVDEKDNSYDLTMDPITSRKLLGDIDFDKDTIYTIIYEAKSETIVGINVHNTN